MFNLNGVKPGGEIHFFDAVGLHPKQRKCIEAMTTREAALIFGGGSGMGGKSYCLRAAAVWWHLWMFKNGYHGLPSVFATSTYKALKQRHIRMFKREWGHLGKYYGNHGEYGQCFLFDDPRMGAIVFLNLEDPDGYRGTEFTAGFLDETTENVEGDFFAFCYMIRSPEVPIHPILTMSNPDGVGYTFCKTLWRPQLYDAASGECLDMSARLEPFGDEAGEGFDLDPEDFIYIPFLPDDNPQFNEAAFNRGTAGLPPHIKRARRYGLWDAPEGARWAFLDPKVHLFSLQREFPNGIPEHWTRIVGIDYGLRAPYAAIWSAIDYDGNVWTYRVDYQAGLTADAQAERVLEKTGPNEKISAIYLDPSMWNRNPGHDGPVDITTADQYRDILCSDPRFPTGLTKGYNKSRVHALTTLDKLLRRENDYPNWHIENHCNALWGELTGAIFQKGTVLQELSEDIDDRCPDHAITASYYSLHTHLKLPTRAKQRPDVEQQMRTFAGDREKLIEKDRRKFIREEKRRVNIR